jgi:hypothetical protein
MILILGIYSYIILVILKDSIYKIARYKISVHIVYIYLIISIYIPYN